MKNTMIRNMKAKVIAAVIALAAIAGSISSAVDDVPNEISQPVIALLSQEFCTILLRFNELVAKREQIAL